MNVKEFVEKTPTDKLNATFQSKTKIVRLNATKQILKTAFGSLFSFDDGVHWQIPNLLSATKNKLFDAVCLTKCS